MPVSSDFDEQFSRLNVTMTGDFDAKMIEELKVVLLEGSKQRMVEILVGFVDVHTVYSPSEGLEFANFIGTKVSKTLKAIAIAKQGSPEWATVVDAAIFNTGILVGQFETDTEAAAWLDQKRL